MPNLWRKKRTKQGYNYLDRFIQQMPGFFETRLENQETPVALSTVKKPPKKRKKRYSNKQNTSSYEDFDKDSLEDEKPSITKKFCQYRGKCSHCTDECTTFKDLILMIKSRRKQELHTFEKWMFLNLRNPYSP